MDRLIAQEHTGTIGRRGMDGTYGASALDFGVTDF